LKTHFNIIISSTPSSPMYCLLSAFTANRCIYHLHHAYRPSHPSSLIRSNNIWWRVQIAKFLKLRFKFLLSQQLWKTEFESYICIESQQLRKTEFESYICIESQQLWKTEFESYICIESQQLWKTEFESYICIESQQDGYCEASHYTIFSILLLPSVS
jgi:hypothetical protein